MLEVIIGGIITTSVVSIGILTRSGINQVLGEIASLRTELGEIHDMVHDLDKRLSLVEFQIGIKKEGKE